MQDNPTVFWFRNDLRTHDLPALSAAAAAGKPVLACYVLDDESPGDWRMGEASRWWLHHSLGELARDVEALGGSLYLARGRPEKVLADLVEAVSAEAVYCSRQYAPWSSAQEDRVSTSLGQHNVDLCSLTGSLLWEPEEVMTGAGTPFKVFTPFWRACKARPEPALPLGKPTIKFWTSARVVGEDLSDLGLIRDAHKQPPGWQENWSPGEQGAEIKLRRFLEEVLEGYATGRDRPDLNATSRLSPHLQFGEISPNRVYHSVKEAVLRHPELAPPAEKFLSELGWREFSHHLLQQFPRMPEQEFKPSFAAFPWVGNAESLQRWQEGKTGYPMVDAGMRELRQTGYMHGRVRMVVASFLCKHLLVNCQADFT